MHSTLLNPLIEAIEHPLFPSVDMALRSGKHISHGLLAEYLFLNDHFPSLQALYQRYHVHLLQASERYFYLRPQATSLIPRRVLSPLEMLMGKTLCLLYLDPKRISLQNRFSIEMVLTQLFSLLDPIQLMRLVHPRAQGSDLDKQRFLEKLKSALFQLRRMGMITFCKSQLGEPRIVKSDTIFQINEAIFRFAAELRTDATPHDAQKAFILQGEAAWISDIENTVNEEREREGAE